MIGFIGIIVLGCGISHYHGCYKPYDRTLIHANALDSDEEGDPDLDINADSVISRRPEPNKCKIFFRRQWTFNCVAFILSIIYFVIGGFAVSSLSGGGYGYEATKPLDLPQEFTFKIRDWAVRPYVDIRVQPDECI